ncbi:MAG TPA: 2-isopropylmalate synthase, partial [Candidatus Melainabacteria bacterium]|nr:2-isopropylmalate synthase [Candidatus Melainabacteria bacterium]
MNSVDSRPVKIFDTTLRDGQQCPGAAMSFENNIRYFQLAAAMRVDILEAGFPAASALDFEIVRTIAEISAEMESSPIIAALCQLRGEQVERTIEALKPL